VVGEREKNLGP